MCRLDCSSERAREPRIDRRSAAAHSGAALRIDVFTIFPRWLTRTADERRRARETEGLVDIRIHDLRSAATDPHRTVDDAPFGGGAGMVLAPEPVFGSVELANRRDRSIYWHRGPTFRPVGRHRAGRDRARCTGVRTAAFSLLCGRYEGVDQRIADHLADGELSVGDFVLAGGELAALVVVEATARLVPGYWAMQPPPATRASRPGCSSTPVHTPRRIPRLAGA